MAPEAKAGQVRGSESGTGKRKRDRSAKKRKRDRSAIGNMGKQEAKAGQVRYWQYGQAEKSPGKRKRDRGSESGTGPLLAIWASRKVA